MIAAGDLDNIIVEIERCFYFVGGGRGIKLDIAYNPTVRKLNNTVGVLLGKLAVVGNDYYKLCFGKLFKAAEETPQEPVLETTYYYEKWRSYATGIIEPVADKMIAEAYADLQEYFKQLSAAFVERIGQLIQEVTEEKEQVSSQLSEDERLLQADNDWHTAFCDKLRDIERS